MKLLIAADIFPPESGGPATYVVTLANELVKQGVQVAVVSLNPNSDRSVLDSRVELAMVSSSVKLLRYWQYYQMLKQCGKSADLIYAMGPVNAGYPALRAAQKLGIKLVVKVVGDYAWEQGQVLGLTREPVDDFQRTKHGGKIGRLKKIEARVVKAADQVITPSEYLKKIVVGWGAEEKKVQVIYNEVPFEPVNSLVHPGEHWIVSAGRLVPWKKMETLIEVMPEVLKKVPDAKLKIVGDGPEFAALASKISKLHLENVVELTGALSRAQTQKYIASSDVFILNSGYEGFSHVLIEAQMQGVPTIASRTGGNTEVVAGDNLFEFDNKEEIAATICRFIFEKKGPKIQHRFSTNLIPDTKKILEDLCANS